MFGTMSTRSYIIIAVVCVIVFLLLGLIAKDGIATFVEQTRVDAIAAGLAPFLADAIAVPVRLAFSGEILPAVIAGLLWPLVLLWVILLLVMLIFAFILPGVGAARGAIS